MSFTRLLITSIVFLATAILRVAAQSNNCPIANATNVLVAEGGQGSFQLPASDPDGDALEYMIIQPPVHGIVVLQILTGAASYSPSSGYVGPDSFTYLVTDGQCESAVALVSIQVTNSNHCPTADPVSLSVAPGGQVNFQLLGSDADGDALQYSIIQPPLHGIVVVQIQTGAASYSPNGGYTGPDSFTYKVNDGQCDSTAALVSISVGTTNQAPTANITSPNLVDFSPMLPNPVLIAGDGSSACVILDGSTSSDPESAANDLTYSWFLEPSSDVFASGVRATNCLQLGTYTFDLIVNDPQGASGMDTLTIDVLTPCETEGALILMIQNSTLPRNVQRPLITSLKGACAAFERDGGKAGVSQLETFQSKVRTHVSDPILAQQLTDVAQAIIDALTGP